MSLERFPTRDASEARLKDIVYEAVAPLLARFNERGIICKGDRARNWKSVANALAAAAAAEFIKSWTGAKPGYRICSKCEDEKHLKLFGKKHGKDEIGKCTRCKACVVKANNEWRQRLRPGVKKEINRRARVRHAAKKKAAAKKRKASI